MNKDVTFLFTDTGPFLNVYIKIEPFPLKGPETNIKFRKGSIMMMIKESGFNLNKYDLDTEYLNTLYVQRGDEIQFHIHKKIKSIPKLKKKLYFKMLEQ